MTYRKAKRNVVKTFTFIITPELEDKVNEFILFNPEYDRSKLIRTALATFIYLKEEQAKEEFTSVELDLPKTPKDKYGKN